MSTPQSELKRNFNRRYLLTSKLARINEKLRNTKRLDKKRLLKAKGRHVSIFLKIVQLREENILRSMRLINRYQYIINRYQYILKRKQSSCLSRFSVILHKVAKLFTRFLFKFASFFSALSPPPSSFARNWSFTEEELYLWSKNFYTALLSRVKLNRTQLISKVKLNMTQLISKVKLNRTQLLSRVKLNRTQLISKVKLNMTQLRLNIKGNKAKWHRKSKKLLSKVSISVNKGKERAFKYVR